MGMSIPDAQHSTAHTNHTPSVLPQPKCLIRPCLLSPSSGEAKVGTVPQGLALRHKKGSWTVATLSQEAKDLTRTVRAILEVDCKWPRPTPHQSTVSTPACVQEPPLTLIFILDGPRFLPAAFLSSSSSSSSSSPACLCPAEFQGRRI